MALFFAYYFRQGPYDAEIDSGEGGRVWSKY